MGLHKNIQLEQDELNAFVDAIHRGFLNDPEDVCYNHCYDSIYREAATRFMRDERTGRFIGKVDGQDWHWNDSTIVFAPDDDLWLKPVVIKEAANINAIADQDVGYHGLKFSDL